MFTVSTPFSEQPNRGDQRFHHSYICEVPTTGPLCRQRCFFFLGGGHSERRVVERFISTVKNWRYVFFNSDRHILHVFFGGGSCNRFEYATICERRFWTHHEKSRLFYCKKRQKKSVDAPKNFDCSKPSSWKQLSRNDKSPPPQGLYGWWRCRSCLAQHLRPGSEVTSGLVWGTWWKKTPKW